MGDTYRPDRATGDTYRPSQQDRRRRLEESRDDPRMLDSWRPADTQQNMLPAPRPSTSPAYTPTGPKSANQHPNPLLNQWRPDPTRPPFDSSKYRSQVPNNLLYQRRPVATRANDGLRQARFSPTPDSNQFEAPKSQSSYNLRSGPKAKAAVSSTVNALAHRPKPPKNPGRKARAPGPDSTIPRGHRDATPSAPPVPVPKVEPWYLTQSKLPPLKLAAPQPLLLIMDLNGTLILRNRHSKNFIVRSNAAHFISYVLANHTVMIWSSARPENVHRIVNKLLPKEQRQKLVAVWGRDKLDLTQEQYNEKVQVYKCLQKVWEDKSIQAAYPAALWPRKTGWNQTNTVLIDDSRVKAVAQPHNLIEIPEFLDANERHHAGPPVLDDVMRMLEILSYQEDVSRFLRLQSEKHGCVTSEIGIPCETGVAVDTGLATEEKIVDSAKDSDSTLSEDDEAGGIDLVLQEGARGIDLVPQEEVGADEKAAIAKTSVGGQSSVVAKGRPIRKRWNVGIFGDDSDSEDDANGVDGVKQGEI